MKLPQARPLPSCQRLQPSVASPTEICLAPGVRSWVLWHDAVLGLEQNIPFKSNFIASSWCSKCPQGNIRPLKGPALSVLVPRFLSWTACEVGIWGELLF